MAVKLMEPIKLAGKDKDNLVDMAANLIILERELEKAERAGIDVKDIKRRFQEMKKLRDGLLREYV